MLKFGNIVLTNNSNWLNIPEHNVITSGNHGTVTASPNKGIQGTEVTLSNSPESGYEFSSYSVTGAELYDGNKLTIGTTDVSVVGTFASVGGYCTMSVTALTPPGQSSYCKYYISLPETHSAPFALPNSYTMTVRRNQNARIMNYNGPDNVTNLTINEAEDNPLECVIGNNTFNSVTALILPSADKANHLPISIGDNSLNNFAGTFSRYGWNVDLIPIYIGNNSCAKMTLEMSNNDILVLGTNSLSQLNVLRDSAFIYLPSGNIGSRIVGTAEVGPAIYYDATGPRLYGDVKTCMLQSALARGATLNSSGNLINFGFVINYQGDSTSHAYTFHCPNATDDDLAWLNANKLQFMTGNNNLSRVVFSRGD